MSTLLECDYQTLVNDCTVYGLNNFFGVPTVDIDTGKPKCYVNWVLEPEARRWGIRSISVYATRVVTTIEWEVYTEDLTKEEKDTLIIAGGKEYQNGTISRWFEVDSYKEWNGKKWAIASEFKIGEDGMCIPQDVEIDFETMVITVS